MGFDDGRRRGLKPSYQSNFIAEGKMVNRIKTNQDMTEGPLFGKMIKFALPLIATGLLQVLYNASDMVVVGNFSPSGANAMGAVGACGSLINLILNLFIGLSTGAGIVVAQNVGAKRYNDVKDVIHTSFHWTFDGSRHRRCSECRRKAI